jgi:adenylate cyclase
MSGTDPAGVGSAEPGARKLIAVVYADMVGYSRLISQDDAGTMHRLRRLRKALIDPVVREHGGSVVQTGGDSLLVAFDSLDGAVRCAVKVQQQIPLHDGDQPPDRRIRFRIGINIGDVILDGTNLHGDGVNVAARLEKLSPIGGICVSRSVRDHVHGRLELHFESIGPLMLKNIDRPVEAFTLRLDPEAETGPVVKKGISGDELKPSLTLPDKPSIAVLAFTNLSGDAEQEYFSDGVADDIVTELSRNHSLFVISRNSSFTYKGRAVDVKQVARELGVRYVVEGSVRTGGDRVRVNAQLVDAETGNHLWAERYDRGRTEVFTVQDEITIAVARAIGPAVAGAEQRRALRKPPGSLGAWEAYQRGMWHSTRDKLEDFPRAREFFNRALELDPTLAAAHTGLASLYGREGRPLASRPLAEALTLAADEERKAIELDPTDADAHAGLALTLGSTGDHAGACDHVERARSINPNCALAHLVSGWLLVFAGRTAEGRDAIQFGTRLDPSRITDLWVRTVVALSHYLDGDYDKTVAIAKAMVSDRPDVSSAYRWMAAALGQLGRGDEARDALRNAIAIAPDAFDLHVRSRVPWMRQIDYDHLLDGIRKAGWHG